MINEPSYTPQDKVFVVCTGPSLKGFDFNLLKGQHVIAVNDAHLFVPNQDAFVAIDHPYYETHFETLSKLEIPAYAIAGYYTTERMNNMGLMKVIYLENTGFSGIDYTKGKVRFGGNSGYTAINVAINLGAKDIRLLGMDMGVPTGHSAHFFDTDDFYSEHALRHYNFVVRWLRDLRDQLKPDIKITNYSPESKIDAFPKKYLKQLFE